MNNLEKIALVGRFDCNPWAKQDLFLPSQNAIGRHWACHRYEDVVLEVHRHLGLVY